MDAKTVVSTKKPPSQDAEGGSLLSNLLSFGAFGTRSI